MKMEIDYRKKIEDFERNNDLSKLKSIKIAVLGTYTLNNILFPLKSKLYDCGFNPEIKFGGYNQFVQEMMDHSSWLYQFKPDMVFLTLSTGTYLKGLEFNLIGKDRDYFNNLINEKIGFIKTAINSFNLPAKIVLTSLEHSSYSPYGLKDATMPNGLNALIGEFNNKLTAMANENPHLVLLDFERFCLNYGKNNIFDEKMFFLGKILFNNYGAEKFADQFAEIINSAYGNLKKVIVVDLDNTLWKGVIGEDGVDGLEMTEDTNMGSIYHEIQKILLNYKKMGALLAIVSKNNPSDAELILKQDNDMVLKESDFIARRINWESKSKNIQDIANELNLGLDSFVFIDDNPAERLEVQSRLPMVKIIDFPNDVALLPKILREMPYFNSLTLTEEDLKRNEMYQQEKERNRLKEETGVEEYLHKLEIKIKVNKNDLSSLERITQLINKTNQFNLRTQRYTQEQVKDLMTSQNSRVFSLHVWDKFGELGLTGIIILKKEDNSYFIDSFLMSCRILARKIENQFFAEVIKHLENTCELTAEFISTPKNDQVRNFYESIGLGLVSEGNNIKKYRKSLKELTIKDIEWIKAENG